jgi:endonuclease YncB( thermonuclease family)
MRKKTIWHATAQVIACHDGDTFKARIDLLENRDITAAQKVDLGFHLLCESAYNSDAIANAAAAGVHFYLEMNIRLFSFGAPELSERGGPEAARALAELLPIGATVRLESRRLDKYGRAEAIVTTSDGHNIGELMFTAGHVRHATSAGYID